MRLGELVDAVFGHQIESRRSGAVVTARRSERAKPPRASARSAQARVADVRAAARQALLGIGRSAPVDDDEAPQRGLVRARARSPTQRALRDRYEVGSTGSSRASSVGTSTATRNPAGPGLGLGRRHLTSSGWLASAWWASRPQ